MNIYDVDSIEYLVQNNDYMTIRELKRRSDRKKLKRIEQRLKTKKDKIPGNQYISCNDVGIVRILPVTKRHDIHNTKSDSKSNRTNCFIQSHEQQSDNTCRSSKTVSQNSLQNSVQKPLHKISPSKAQGSTSLHLSNNNEISDTQVSQKQSPPLLASKEDEKKSYIQVSNQSAKVKRVSDFQSSNENKSSPAQLLHEVKRTSNIQSSNENKCSPAQVLQEVKRTSHIQSSNQNQSCPSQIIEEVKKDSHVQATKQKSSHVQGSKEMSHQQALKDITRDSLEKFVYKDPAYGMKITVEGDIDWKAEKSLRSQTKIKEKEKNLILATPYGVELEKYTGNIPVGIFLPKKRTIVVSQSAHLENCLFNSFAEWIHNVDFETTGEMQAINLPNLYRKFWAKNRDRLVNKRLKIESDIPKDSVKLKIFLNDLIYTHGDALFEAFTDYLPAIYRNANEMKERAQKASDLNYDPSLDLRGGIEHIILISLLCQTPVMVWQHYDESLYEIYTDTSFALHIDLLKWPELYKVIEYRKIDNPYNLIIHLLYNAKEEKFEACSHYETLVVFDF